MKINFFNTDHKSQSLDALTMSKKDKANLPAKTVRVTNTQDSYSQKPQKEPKKVTWSEQLTTVRTLSSVRLAEPKLSSHSSPPMSPPMSPSISTLGVAAPPPPPMPSASDLSRKRDVSQPAEPARVETKYTTNVKSSLSPNIFLEMMSKKGFSERKVAADNSSDSRKPLAQEKVDAVKAEKLAAKMKKDAEYAKMSPPKTEISAEKRLANQKATETSKQEKKAVKGNMDAVTKEMAAKVANPNLSKIKHNLW